MGEEKYIDALNEVIPELYNSKIIANINFYNLAINGVPFSSKKYTKL